MATIAQAYQSIANVNLWFKLQNGAPLVLTDIPSIIPLRWTYFSQNWNIILPTLQALVSGYQFSDLFAAQLIEFTNFVNVQRNNASIINPLSNIDVLYQFYTVFDNITIKSINLTTQEQTLLTNATTIVSQYTRNNFTTLQTIITSYRDAQADIIG